MARTHGNTKCCMYHVSCIFISIPHILMYLWSIIEGWNFWKFWNHPNSKSKVCEAGVIPGASQSRKTMVKQWCNANIASTIHQHPSTSIKPDSLSLEISFFPWKNLSMEFGMPAKSTPFNFVLLKTTFLLPTSPARFLSFQYGPRFRFTISWLGRKTTLQTGIFLSWIQCNSDCCRFWQNGSNAGKNSSLRTEKNTQRFTPLQGSGHDHSKTV